MRFHCGISFSWRTIKKFLLPFLLGLLAYFGFSFIVDNQDSIKSNISKYLLGVQPVYAYTNSDTSWNLTMRNYDEELRNTSCGDNGTFYDVVNNMIDTISTDYYTLMVGAPASSNNSAYSITFYIKVKSSIQFNRIRYYAYKPSTIYKTQFKMYYSGNTDRMPYYTITNQTCSTYQNGSDYIAFKNLTDTGDTSYAPSISLGNFNYNNYSMPVFTSDEYTIGDTISNDLSYNVDNWFYYSSTNYIYSYYFSTTNTSYYVKDLCIIDNDICYTNGDIVPSYYQLHHNDNPSIPSFIGYKTSLDTFYTSIPVNNVSNYQLKFKFDVPQSLLGFYQTPQEYIDNTSFDFICSGRVNNSNYYTYENFNCSLTSSYTSNDSSIEYTFNNFTTSKNLSNYDKIYITLNTKYLDCDVSTTIYNLTYTYSLGDFYNTTYKGSIYEKLTLLPLNFRLYFSSNNSLQNSSLYVSKYNFINYNINYIGFSNTTQNQNLIIGSSILGNNNNGENVDFISTTVSNNIDTGIMIYQNNGAIPVPSLEMFFNGGFVLSLNTNLSSDTFYYIDNEGVIQSNNYSIPIQDTSSNVYDISYYVGLVNSFIDDLSDDSLQFSYLTQNFYNSLPIFFQNFIFIIFILVCIYFTYKLIKK